MAQKSNIKREALCGEVCIEIDTLPNPDGDMEIQKIYDITLMFGSGHGRTVHVNLDEFKNGDNQSVGDVLMGWANIAKIEALVVEQRQKEAEQEAYDRAADDFDRNMA